MKEYGQATSHETSYPTNRYMCLFFPFLFHEKDPWDQQQKVISHKAFDVGNTLGPETRVLF
jgi:hypothetical protein